jgi:glycosyltransferase involved in cell wall biosynthesis
MKLFAHAPDNMRQLSGTAYNLTLALGCQASDRVEVVPLRLLPHSEFASARLAYMLRHRSLRARSGFGLSSEYYSAAYGKVSPHTFGPDDLFLSYHQVAPRQVMRHAQAGRLRAAAYIDMSLREYLETYSSNNSIPPHVVEDLLKQERACMAIYDRIFVFDDIGRDSIVREFDLNPEKVVVVGRGVNMGADELAAVRKNRETRSRRELQLLFLGKDAARKGLHETVRAIDRLSSDLRGKLVLHVAGPAHDEVPDRTYIRSHGFLDREKDKDRILGLLSDCAVGVLLTEAEGGVPSAILEYLACGIPAIITNLPRIQTTLEQEAVTFVDVGNREEGFFKVLRDLLEHPDQLAARTRAAEARRDTFGWSSVASRLLDAASTRPTA